MARDCPDRMRGGYPRGPAAGPGKQPGDAVDREYEVNILTCYIRWRLTLSSNLCKNCPAVADLLVLSQGLLRRDALKLALAGMAVTTTMVVKVVMNT